MSRFSSIIIFTLLIIVVSSTPLTSIPIVLLNFKVNGLLAGYFVLFFSGLITSIIQYYFAKKFILKFIKNKFPKKFNFIKKYSLLISDLSFIEFLLFLLPGTIPSSLIAISSGMANMNIKKFLICIAIISVPQQFIFLITASLIDLINEK